VSTVQQWTAFRLSVFVIYLTFILGTYAYTTS